MGKAMKRATIYLRVSTQDQTTSNQEHELRQAAERAGWQVAKVYKDHGISGAKGRNGRPAFDALCRDATKRQFDVVMAWNVDRLGRSLKDLVAFLSELHALGIDLFLHQIGCAAPRRRQAPIRRCDGLERRSPGPQPERPCGVPDRASCARHRPFSASDRMRRAATPPSANSTL